LECDTSDTERHVRRRDARIYSERLLELPPERVGNREGVFRILNGR
jgi:hypothetical protein